MAIYTHTHTLSEEHCTIYIFIVHVFFFFCVWAVYTDQLTADHWRVKWTLIISLQWDLNGWDILDSLCWMQNKNKIFWVTFTGAWIVIDWVRASPELQLLWDFPSLRWSEPTKSGTRKKNWLSTEWRKLIGAHGEWKLALVVWYNRKAPVAQIDEFMLVPIKRSQNTQCS